CLLVIPLAGSRLRRSPDGGYGVQQARRACCTPYPPCFCCVANALRAFATQQKHLRAASPREIKDNYTGRPLFTASITARLTNADQSPSKPARLTPSSGMTSLE